MSLLIIMPLLEASLLASMLWVGLLTDDMMITVPVAGNAMISILVARGSLHQKSRCPFTKFVMAAIRAVHWHATWRTMFSFRPKSKLTPRFRSNART